MSLTTPVLVEVRGLVRLTSKPNLVLIPRKYSPLPGTMASVSAEIPTREEHEPFMDAAQSLSSPAKTQINTTKTPAADENVGAEGTRPGEPPVDASMPGGPEPSAQTLAPVSSENGSVDHSPEHPLHTGASGSVKSAHSARSAKSGARSEAESASADSVSPELAAQKEFREIAAKLYNEEFVLIGPEEYTQFLAAQDPDSATIREYYMDLFHWDVSLLKSTRMLCLKLFLKGESQEIDRILSAFTKSYLKQNPVNVFCTRDFEKIYIVLYSLILLNTALHNLELSKKSKISQSEYIKNTFTTFLSQNRKAAARLSIKQKILIERELNFYYEDLARTELYLKRSDVADSPAKSNTNRYSVAETIRSNILGPESEHPSSPRPKKSAEFHELSRQASNNSTWSVDGDGKRRVSLGMKRMNTATSATSQATVTPYTSSHAPSAGRFGFTRALLSDSARNASLRNHKSIDHMRNLSRRSSRASVITKDSHKGSDDAVSVASMKHMAQFELPEVQNQYDVEDFDVDDFQDKFDLKLELQGAPYLKEGLLKLKIFNNDMADSTTSGDAPTSSAALAVSVGTLKLGFFSFFNRSFSSHKEPNTTLGTNSNKVFNQKFTEYFVVVSKGELRLYSFDPKTIKKHQLKVKKMKKQQEFYTLESEDEEDVGDGNWLNSAANIGNYNLCSTIAQMDKSPQELSLTNAKITWSLTFPKISKKPQKKFVFEAGTAEVAQEFINTCNFWASKLTAVPTLEESVSSIEYGWTNLDGLISMNDGFRKAKGISKWEQLPKGVYLSNFMNNGLYDSEAQNHEGMLKQFIQTLKYYNHLKTLFNAFNRQKTQFMKSLRRFSTCSNYKLVSNNFENKSQEYKAELSKYKSYIAMLGFGLKLRFDLEEKDREELWAEELAEDPSFEGEAILTEIERRRLDTESKETELTKAVKVEVEKLIHNSASVRQIFASDPLRSQILLSSAGTGNDNYFDDTDVNEMATSSASLVKSPKTFSLSNFKEEETSPINQLLSADGLSNGVDKDHGLNMAKKELIMSFSTNTIREEDEPEDSEETLSMKK